MNKLFPCIPEILGPEILEPLKASTSRWPFDGNRTMAFLAHQLARPIDAPPSNEEKRALDALCRKIDIVKKLMKHYDEDWKTPYSDDLAPDQAWALTAALFIHVSQFYLNDGEGRTGQALKYLNTAFNAINLVDEHKQVLGDLAQKRLDELSLL